MRTQARALLVVCALLAFGVDVLALDLSTKHDPSTTASALTTKAFPLKVSANNRYLVDRDGAPFLMVGVSPQGLIGNLSEDEAAAYIANRETYGICCAMLAPDAGPTAPPQTALFRSLCRALSQVQIRPTFIAPKISSVLLTSMG